MSCTAKLSLQVVISSSIYGFTFISRLLFKMILFYTLVTLSAICISNISLQVTPPSNSNVGDFFQQFQSKWQPIPGQVQNYWQDISKNAQNFGSQVAKSAVDKAKITRDNWSQFASDVKNSFAQNPPTTAKTPTIASG